MFRKFKGIKLPYKKQGLIYFICMNIKEFPLSFISAGTDMAYYDHFVAAPYLRRGIFCKEKLYRRKSRNNPRLYKCITKRNGNWRNSFVDKCTTFYYNLSIKHI